MNTKKKSQQTEIEFNNGKNMKQNKEKKTQTVSEFNNDFSKKQAEKLHEMSKKLKFLKGGMFEDNNV